MLRAFSMMAIVGATFTTALAADVPRKPTAEETARWKHEVSKLLKDLPYGYPRLDGKEVETPPAAVALRAIGDPAALPAIVALLGAEGRTNARLLLVEVAAKFRTDEALALMVKVGITDGDKFVRRAAIATWKDFQRPNEILALLPRYIESENLRYAALDALEKSGVQISPGEQPNKVLVKTLIKHLYRKVEQRMPVEYYETGTFNGGRGRYGEGRQTIVKVTNLVPDTAVRTTLHRLTGQDYIYDQIKWTNWANTQK